MRPLCRWRLFLKKLFQSYFTSLAGGMGDAGPEDLSPRVPGFGPLGPMMAMHPGEGAAVRSHHWSSLLLHLCGGTEVPPKGPVLWVRGFPSPKARSAAGLGSPGHV